MNEETTILARGAAVAAAEASPLVMWMPGGVQKIQASNAKGEPVAVSVQVDSSTAAAAQRALEAHVNASAQRPFFDFDHAGEAASAWPTGFVWQDTPVPGVYAQVEWSDKGKEAILGRMYRAFSPSFFIDANNPAKVTGAPLNMGGLVNDPAFKGILPLWARNNTLALVGSGAATDRPMEEENDGTAGAAAATTTVTASATQGAEELATLRAQLAQANEAIKAARKANAERLVQAAVARGALAPQNTALHAKWVETLTADPASAALLNGLEGSPVLNQRVTASGVSVQMDEIGTVLKAYHAEKDPAKRSTIYAKSIQPVMKPDNDSLIVAANSLGTLVGDLVVQRSLTLLKYQFPLLSRITTDFSAENASYNQTIRTRTRAIPAATDYNASTGYASSDVTDTDVTIAINAHKAVQITFTANDLASTRRLLFGEQEEGIQYALGKTIVDALYALFTVANYTNKTTQSIVTTSRATLLEMAKQLNLRGVPMMNRTVLLNSYAFGQLAADPTIVSLATFQRPDLITQYTLPNIANFQPLEAPNLPSTGNLSGFAFTPDAVCLATRLPNDYTNVFPGATGGGVTSVVTNPDTGMSVMLVQFIDHKLGAAYMRVAVMYGVSTGQVASGQLLVTA